MHETTQNIATNLTYRCCILIPVQQACVSKDLFGVFLPRQGDQLFVQQVQQSPALIFVGPVSVFSRKNLGGDAKTDLSVLHAATLNCVFFVKTHD